MSNEFQVLTGASYEGARHGRRMAGWRTTSAGPNRTVNDSLETLRKRSRDACRNNANAAAVVQTWTRSLIGQGISARSAASDPTTKAKLNDLWAAWCRTADTDGGDFAGVQQLVIRAWLESGECFVRMRPRKTADSLPVPLQLQILESDCLPLLDADEYNGLPAGHCIRSGIELDAIGRRVAYWFWRAHPQDATPPNIPFNELTRVPAEQVCHLYEPTRPGQLRGVPILSPVLAKMRTLDDFTDAVLERQRLANLFVTFIKRPLPSGATDPMTGLPYQGSADEPIAAMEPGTSQELLPGEDVTFSSPPGADQNFAEYLRAELLQLAAGTGLPYEYLTGDLKDVSDRTARLAITEYRRACEQKIWGVIVPRFLDRVRAAWAMAAYIGGPLTQDEAGEALAVHWTPQAWAPLHPTQDLQAAKMAVDAGFRSRASVIASFGDDPEQVDRERADDRDRAEALGLQTADEAKAAAEIAKLQAEAAAAEKAAEAAQQTAQQATAKAREARAQADLLAAQRKTTDEQRRHEIAASQDRATLARLEREAAEVALRELKGADQ